MQTTYTRSHTVTASLHDKGQFIPSGFNPIVHPVSNDIFSDNMYLKHHDKFFAQPGPASLHREKYGRFTPFATHPGAAVKYVDEENGLVRTAAVITIDHNRENSGYVLKVQCMYDYTQIMSKWKEK